MLTPVGFPLFCCFLGLAHSPFGPEREEVGGQMSPSGRYSPFLLSHSPESRLLVSDKNYKTRPESGSVLRIEG